MEYLEHPPRTIDYQRISKGAWGLSVFWAAFAIRGRLGEGAFSFLPDVPYVWLPLWIAGSAALVYSWIQLRRGGFFR